MVDWIGDVSPATTTGVGAAKPKLEPAGTATHQQAQYDAGASAISRIASAEAPAKSPIVYFGLNPGAGLEVSALRSDANNTAGVTAIEAASNAGEPAHIDAAAAFRAQGMPPAKCTLVTKQLDSTAPALRGLVKFLLVFWEGEQGTRTLDRLVLSAHTNGLDLWGDDTTHVSWDAIKSLLAAFPLACAGVRHVFIAGCNSGWEANVDWYRSMFPHLQSVWGYTETAPGAATGGAAHLRRWETETDGAGDMPSRASAQGTRDGEDVAVWTATGGYASQHATMSAADFDHRHSDSDGLIKALAPGSTFMQQAQAAYEGDAVPGVAGDALYVLYSQVERLLGSLHPGEGGVTFRTPLTYWLGNLLRLRFWSKIMGLADQHFGDAIRATVQACSIENPALTPLGALSTMTRKQFTLAWHVLKDVPDARLPAGPAREGLGHLGRLYALDTNEIPDEWC